MRKMITSILCILTLTIVLPLNLMKAYASYQSVTNVVLSYVPNSPNTVSNIKHLVTINHQTINLNLQANTIVNGAIRIESNSSSFTPFYITTPEAVDLNYTISPYNSETIIITFVPYNTNQYGYSSLNISII